MNKKKKSMKKKILGNYTETPTGIAEAIMSSKRIADFLPSPDKLVAKKSEVKATMINTKTLETVADIAYIAGYHKYYSGDSRLDISQYIQWATEFEKIHLDTDWDVSDYMLLIEEFTERKMRTELIPLR